MNVQRILILNLAVSDILMGVYMLIIAGTDIHYGSAFFWYADYWRLKSTLCKLAGFLALLSSETSIFIITILSIDRFVRLVFPFSNRRFRGNFLYGTLAVTWSLWIAVSLITVFVNDGELYGRSNVCIGLPLVRRYVSSDGYFTYFGAGNVSRNFQPESAETSPTWAFSITIFLGINSICLIIVFVCYLAIFMSVRNSRQSSNRDPDRGEEIKMAVRMGFIVGTDFCCWFPVIVMGILAQSGVAEIPHEVYAYIIVLVMPINSTLNPYIYTINGAKDFIRKRRLRYGSTVTTRTSMLSQRFSTFFSRSGKGNGSCEMESNSTHLTPLSPRKSDATNDNRATAPLTRTHSPNGDFGNDFFAENKNNGNYLLVELRPLGEGNP